MRLTNIYLDRLKKYGPKLECVITLTEELALKQARRADREIAAGRLMKWTILASFSSVGASSTLAWRMKNMLKKGLRGEG